MIQLRIYRDDNLQRTSRSSSYVHVHTCTRRISCFDRSIGSTSIACVKRSNGLEDWSSIHHLSMFHFLHVLECHRVIESGSYQNIASILRQQALSCQGVATGWADAQNMSFCSEVRFWNVLENFTLVAQRFAWQRLVPFIQGQSWSRRVDSHQQDSAFAGAHNWLFPWFAYQGQDLNFKQGSYRRHCSVRRTHVMCQWVKMGGTWLLSVEFSMWLVRVGEPALGFQRPCQVLYRSQCGQPLTKPADTYHSDHLPTEF